MEIRLEKNIANVIKLFISRTEEPKRQNREELYLDEKGIHNDKFYNKDIIRSVLLSSIHSYELAEDNGIHMEYGSLGENILIDYNVYNLSMGTQLKIGEVIVEITQNCTICNYLSIIDKSLPKLLRNDRGIFVKVIQSGVIKEGDSLSYY